MADNFQLKAILSAVDKITPTTTQIGKSVRILHKSLRDIGNAGGELMRKIGVPAFLSFSAVSYAAINATKSALEYAGSIQDASDRSTTSTDSFQALTNMLGLVGGTAEDAEMAFTKFNKGIQLAASGGDKNFAGLLKKLHIPLKDSKKQIQSLTAVLPDLAQAFAKNKGKETIMAMTLFGKGGTKMIPVMKGLADGSISLADAMKSIVDNKSLSDLDNMGDSLTVLNTKTKNTLTGALAKMVPAIQPIIDSMDKWITANQVLIKSTIVEVLTEVVTTLKQINWKESFKDLKSIIVDVKDFIKAIGGVKTLIYGMGIAWIAGPIAAIGSIIGAIWRLRLAFTALSISATTSGAAVAGSFGVSTTASLVSSLGLIARSAGLLGSAALVGYGIGMAINSALSDATKDKIGETIAKALAMFGNAEAQAALNQNGVSRGSATLDTVKTFAKALPGIGGIYSAADGAFGGSKPNLVGNQTKLNGQLNVKFENAPAGMRVDAGKTNQPGVNLNADVGYRSGGLSGAF